MHKLKYLAISFSLVAALTLAGRSLNVSARPLAATTPVGLGTAGDFAVLGASAVNDSNPSVIRGSVGLSPAAWPPAPVLTCAEVVTGTIYSVDASGPLPCRVTNASVLTIAKNNLTTAYNDAAGRGPIVIGTELGGVTLLDGVYASEAGTFQISSAATLTLDGQGNRDSVFIFKMASTLTTLSNSNVVLTNSAQACNVFWQVGSSAVLGTGTHFVGTIMADQSITDNGGSTVNGRFLARIAAVTLNNTRITSPVCSQAVTPTVTLTPTATATPTNVPPAPRPTSKPTDRPMPTITPVPTVTPVQSPTVTPTPTLLPAVVGLPKTGGAPLRSEDLPWSLVFVGGLGAIAMLFGVRAYRRNRMPKQ